MALEKKGVYANIKSNTARASHPRVNFCQMEVPISWLT